MKCEDSAIFTVRTAFKLLLLEITPMWFQTTWVWPNIVIRSLGGLRPLEGLIMCKYFKLCNVT